LDRKGTKWTRAGHLVGNGPFRLRAWSPNQKIVVERNPDYWDAAAVRLQAIEFYPTDDLPTEERMFRDGQLDATYDLPFSKIDPYRRDHPGELRVDPWLGVYYLNCNVKRPPLDDARVRRALALAIDRASLVRNVLRGGEQPALSLDFPGVAGYTLGAQLTEDPVEARRLLAAAGYPGGKGFPALDLLYNTNEQHRQIGEALQAMWRANLGIEIRLHNEEWKVYLDAEHTHDFQLSRSGWIGDYADPQVFLETWTTGNGNNYSQWSNPRFDRLFAQGLASPTEAGRYAAYRQMDGILADECPGIPIYYYTRTYAMSPRIKGWWPTLLDDHPWKYVYLEN
jgi:oligopeptide transport system substrate-binding protein